MFGKDFLWGAATAAFQIEGAAAEDGRGMSVWDSMCEKKGAIKHGDTGLVACDHYNRYEEDLDLMKQMNLNSYRFSVSWSRVLPDGIGKVNEKGMDFYSRLIDGLLKRNIRPFMTLFHWDFPSELFYKGGWLNRDSADWFADYAVLLAKRFGDRVTDFITLNEPQCYMSGHKNGEHAPGQKYSDREMCRCSHHTMLAHGKAVQAIRANAKKKPSVGLSLCGNYKLPASNSKEDIAAAMKSTESMVCEFGSDILYMDPIYKGIIPAVVTEKYPFYTDCVQDGDLKIISAPLDFFGVNMYTSYFMEAADNKDGFNWLPGVSSREVNSLGWRILPEVMSKGLKYYHDKYGLPIYITENGYCGLDYVQNGEVKDAARIVFLERYLGAVKEAKDAGADVRGYFYWSFLDNFEWAHGYDPRFGLVHVDFDTLKRTVKDSGKWYGKMIKG
jgi:beta-glucosidase